MHFTQQKCKYLSSCCSQEGYYTLSRSLISFYSSAGCLNSSFIGKISSEGVFCLSISWTCGLSGSTSTTFNLFITFWQNGHLIHESLKYRYKQEVQKVCPQCIIIQAALVLRSNSLSHKGQCTGSKIASLNSFTFYTTS